MEIETFGACVDLHEDALFGGLGGDLLEGVGIGIAVEQDAAGVNLSWPAP